ncbi:unnamed protein product [Durusdinium trenchii]|uniref:Cytochrome b5 heme-binding domain-containing protein n=1 Tax=Durusdinium trenchii TaxID=1381693 RepID=A0ABP0JS53_9DINO
MAIFFSILNWGLASTFLTAWRKKDMDMAESCATKAKDFEEKFRQLLHPEDEAHVAEKEMKEEEQSIAEDLPEVVKKPLMQVTPELFASKVQGESGELWLEIDNVAYDLTEFIGKHPGGDQILRQFAGKDASKAFHKAKHSMKAKMQMQMYCVGPMMKELKEYRIFEHTNEVRTLSFSFMQVAALLAFACWLLPYSYYPSVRSLQATESFTARLLAPGLAFAAGTSTLLLPGRQRFNPSTWTCGAIYFAVCFTAILVGLELARRPVVTDAWPSGLEIGAVTIFVVEEVALHLGAEGWRYLYWRRIFLAAGLLLLSWNLRGATLDMVDHSPEHVMGGLLLGLGIPAICRLASSQNEVVMEQALQGLALTTFACLPWLLYLLMPEQDGLRTLALHAWANWTVNTLVMAIASSLCALVFVAMVLSEACASKPLASRSVAVMLSVAVGLRSGWSGWRWLAWLSWFALIGTLGQRHIAVLQSLQKSGKLGELPVQRIAVRSAWEMFYLVLGAMIWQVGQGLFKMLINGVMPQELQFYAPWLPFFELGEDVDVGVAAYYAPKEALKSKVGPHHFVCSVRHLDPSHAEGQRDLQLQQNTVRDMWLKCKDTTAGGLVANVNCFFPRLSGSTHCKEINLSGWVSADAADAWKKQHGSLPGGQGPNSRGQMRTMGSMEAILTPHGEIRHQDRCSSCARLSESATLGEKAPERCKFCGKKNFGYPFF